MFAGGSRAITPQYTVKDDQLQLRPYNTALGALADKICNEVAQGGQERCLFETRTAFDCLLRQKVRKFGDLTDNVSACKHHISNMKQAVGHEAILNKHIDEIQYMRQSFV